MARTGAACSAQDLVTTVKRQVAATLTGQVTAEIGADGFGRVYCRRACPWAWVSGRFVMATLAVNLADASVQSYVALYDGKKRIRDLDRPRRHGSLLQALGSVRDQMTALR